MIKNYSVHGTYPIQLVIEARTRWHPTDVNLDTEEIALVAFAGTERHELAVVQMSGYDASQQPGKALSLLITDVLSV